MTRSDALSCDRDLLERFRAGERRALEAVFMAYEGLVRTIATQGFGGFTGFRNLADADDVISSTFEAAFEERARMAYDGIQPYRHYIGGITRNVIRTMCRKGAREIPVEETPELAADHGGSSAPEAAAEAREDMALVVRFRASLGDPRQVCVFEGYFGRGLSEAALAEELGMNRYRIRLHLARVRKRMRRFLREEGLS
ncbi:MAG: sigma-70 family RNA polymerase sigma factor [Pseudomonadota bacterium]